MNGIHKTGIKLMAIVLAMVSTASADIASDLSNFSLIIGNATSGLTGWTISMMNVFMQPPLLYFVVIGIFVTIVSIVGSLLLRRRKR